MPLNSGLPDIHVPNIAFHQMVLAELRQYSSQTALINKDTDEKFTFDDVISKTEYIARSLLAMGIEKGEPIILCVPNCPEYVWLFLGISLAGAIVCPLHPDYSKDEMRSQLADSCSRFAFAVPNALENLSKLFNELQIDHRVICVGNRKEAKGFPILTDLALTSASCSTQFRYICPVDDLVFLPYSTGTSGPRKGVAISHFMLNAMLKTFNNKDAYDLPDQGDYVVVTTPFHDSFGRDILFTSLINGATVVTTTSSSPDDIAYYLHIYKVRILFVNSTTLKRLCESEMARCFSYYHLKSVVIGSEAISDDIFESTRENFPSVRHFSAVYEMTEVGIVCRTTKNSQFNYRSCGTLCAGLAIMVIDLITGKELGINERGLILVRGQTVFSPYWNNNEATFEDFKHNGWRNTGDIGFYDEHNNVFLVDRAKQIIKVDGLQVTPQELESILLMHPSVDEAAVVPGYTDNHAEVPIAFVVLKPHMSASSDEIKHYINGRVMRHKQVYNVVIALTLPRSPSGKILWRLLRETTNRYA